MFLFGEELLGKGDDFDEDEVRQCIYTYALDKEYIKRAEDKLFREAWRDYCETRNINPRNRKKRDAFRDSILSLTDTNDAIVG
ncbi:MAG: hypothetical protein LUD72_12205, partial [Bacteroidales bacterium]|nr:hypothetical protein [Bacteroidales bacterium]